MILRPYQAEALDALWRYLRCADGNPALVLPTGAGKSPLNGQKGKRSAKAKLSDAQAEVIRNEYAAGGISHAALAVKHGASKRTVGRIIQGKTYV